jgi:hypothetical protein
MLRRSGISLLKIIILLAYGLVLMYSAVTSRAQLTTAFNRGSFPAFKAVAIYTFEGRKVSNIKWTGCMAIHAPLFYSAACSPI